MTIHTSSAILWGVTPLPIHITVDFLKSPSQLQILGVPEGALRETRERVRAAIRNSGYALPTRATVISLNPADQLLREHCPHLDLALALALLAADGHLPQDALRDRLICGELALDGTLRPIRGGLAIAELAERIGSRELLLPAASAAETAGLGSVPVIPLRRLSETVQHLRDEQLIPAVVPGDLLVDVADPVPDLTEVRGQEMGRRALEVAAAGGHHLLLVGPAGSGKTMLARRLPGILPSLTLSESIAVTKIHSLVAEEPPAGLISRRPFRSPHYSASTAGIIGGGSNPRPGEASLAHHGILFLDEAPEFRRDTLEALRQPLDDGVVTLVRSKARINFPARFSLVAATNPCSCVPLLPHSPKERG